MHTYGSIVYTLHLSGRMLVTMSIAALKNKKVEYVNYVQVYNKNRRYNIYLYMAMLYCMTDIKKHGVCSITTPMDAGAYTFPA